MKIPSNLKDSVISKSLDYVNLRKEGLQYIEKFGSNIWTDYNVHDPGITILELLCYAMTDLGYRTSLDIKHCVTDQDTYKIRGTIFNKKGDVLRRIFVEVDELYEKKQLPLSCTYTDDSGKFVLIFHLVY